MGDSPPMTLSPRSHVRLALLRVVTEYKPTDRAKVNTLQFIARQGVISDSILIGIALSLGMSKSMVQSWLCVLYELQFYNEDITTMKEDMLHEDAANELLFLSKSA